MEIFSKLIQNQFNLMCKTGKLFQSSVSGKEVWDLYLGGFNAEFNPVFRDPESSVHNCNFCKNFIRRYGNIVALDAEYNIITMFDVDASTEYANSVMLVSKKLKESLIQDVFIETAAELKMIGYETGIEQSKSIFRLGVASNTKRYTKEEAEKFEVVKPNELRKFNHLFLDIPKQFVDFSGKSAENIQGTFRDSKNVFERTMLTISPEILNLVKDLINQGSLLDGATHLFKINAILPLSIEFSKLITNKDNWCWSKSYNFQFSKFRNELIGTLCVDIADGMDLNIACQTWNKRVDPANYMKASAPITKKQIEDAQKFVKENNYEQSFNRRFATIEDIKLSEILHINSVNKVEKALSIFDSIKPTNVLSKKNDFLNIEEVSIDKFMKDILPTCTSVEAYLTNLQEGNMVSLTTANIKESKPIFKWDNNYSWTFNGNLAGKSQIKESVKIKGGKVDGILRFSIMWAENDPSDNSDLDAWCSCPTATIGYKNKQDIYSGGTLDIDIQSPNAYKNQNIVENITFPTLSRMHNGIYRFWVNQFNNRGSKGFKAEIEFNGELYSYEYNKPVHENIIVAEVQLKDGKFTINHLIPCLNTVNIQKEFYGLSTNQFHKVNLVCLSPNHWDENNVGNKHYFFMLENCKCPTSIRSFHIENLLPELAQHRKVLEVLGNTTMISPFEAQLSGLGFNATVSDELIVKLTGSFNRVVKIKF